MQNYIDALKAYITENCTGMLRDAGVSLKYPYTVPSTPDSPFYSSSLWDWDSWLISIALGQVEADQGTVGRFFDHEIGCILNFLDYEEDGVIPICLNDGKPMLRGRGNEATGASNMHKPVLAQHAAAIVQRTRRTDWLKDSMPGLGRFLQRYLDDFIHRETGLAFWQNDFAVGVDNDPSVFYRPDASCGSIYLNCLLYRELLAYGYLLEELGDVRSSIRWRGRAQDLADAIRAHCWDERDGTFYSVDFALRPVDPNDWLHSGAPRRYSCVLMRIDNWSSFLPMWAGIATQEQAERMVLRCRDLRTFASNGGVRTLSRLEKMYDLRASNNPSNWLGPIWGISNFLVFCGLIKYGFHDDARILADKTIRLFGRDLAVNGSLHEYYHPDTCEPIVTHGFQNWNFLVLNMIAYLEDRKYVEPF